MGKASFGGKGLKPRTKGGNLKRIKKFTPGRTIETGGGGPK